MSKIDLLDHGFVRLVDSMGGDLSIVRAARVSYDAAWRAGEDHGSDERLIRYLWRNRHTTPFEAVTLTFEVKAPIFVFRQWHRHRTWSFNELSARYTELPEEYYLPDPAVIGVQSASSKQARDIGTVDDDALHNRRIEVCMVEDHHRRSFKLYSTLIAIGWPRELARSVLPVATYSHMFATVNLLNLLKFLTLRCDGHAQYEIRVYADALRDLARSVAPVALAAWEGGLGRRCVMAAETNPGTPKMPILTMTLADIRAHSPCAPGWAKLLASLGGASTPMDTRVSLGDVARSNGAADALWCTRALNWADMAVRRAVIAALMPMLLRTAVHLPDKALTECLDMLGRWIAGDNSVGLRAAVGAIARVWPSSHSARALTHDVSVTIAGAALWALGDAEKAWSQVVTWNYQSELASIAALHESQRAHLMAAFPPLHRD